ncbi:MAG: hypothetical protein MUP03_06845 [Anaerolineales bacterium]|nr:hypothetical protein [Anaerolineales bacterium]
MDRRAEPGATGAVGFPAGLLVVAVILTSALSNGIFPGRGYNGAGWRGVDLSGRCPAARLTVLVCA